MKGGFLIDSPKSLLEVNIYADKSSIVLDWLLRVGIHKENFTLREVAKEKRISLGIVQRVFKHLVLRGVLQTSGIRTSKCFSLKRPEVILNEWLDRYNIVKKCKMRTYRSGLQDKQELLEVIKESEIGKKVALALHSAAEAYGCKNTNLNTTELYLLDPDIRQKLEEILLLDPQEKGYEVLLIEPYYKTLLKFECADHTEINVAPSLLTFVDLYHFPLRGQEQAEFMAERIDEIKAIYKG